MAGTDINTQMEDAITASIRSILDYLGWQGTKVILANEGGLEPRETYCLVNILARNRNRRSQSAGTSPVSEVSKIYYTNYYTVQVQVSFIGSDSGDMMFDFEDSVFSSRQCIVFWQENNIGPLNHTGSRRIPQLRETKWIKSYNIDLNLSFAVQSNEVVDWIQDFATVDTIINP